MKNVLKWIGSHLIYTALFVILSAAILLNIMAYKHAQAMLNYVPQGERTTSPEILSFLQKVKILFTGVRIPKPRNTVTPASANLSFEVHHFRTRDEIQLEAWYIPYNQSDCTVLMFHGYAAAKSTLIPEARAFHTLGYATFLLDFRGNGGSSGSRTSIGYHEADDVAQSFEYVRNISPNHARVLYGQSMGSAAILRAISVHQLQPDAIIIESVFDKMLSTVKNRFAAMRFPSFPSAHLLVFWGGLQCGFFGFRHDPVEYARAVQCPVLMLHGEHDPRVTIKESQSVFDNLRGQKHYELFKGVGHESCYRDQPEKWKQIVSQFLKEHL
jgi:alpha-beta hydrolase superfamily lysophospholipase